MKKIFTAILLLFSFFSISALASMNNIPDGMYTGEAKITDNEGNKSIQSLFILVADNHISVLTIPNEETPSVSVGVLDILKFKRYKHTKFIYDGSNLKFNYKHKFNNYVLNIKGTAELVQENLDSTKNPFSGYYNQGIQEGGISCGFGVNISPSGSAILNLVIMPELGGAITISFYGKFSNEGVFEQLNGGSSGPDTFNITSISQTEDEVIITGTGTSMGSLGTTSLGDFSNVFSKTPCELP